jgi:hypothetical protein
LLLGALAGLANPIGARAQSQTPNDAGVDAPAPKRKDRRIGKVHDKIRAQIARDRTRPA